MCGINQRVVPQVRDPAGGAKAAERAVFFMDVQQFYIYFLRSLSGMYYIGYSEDPWERVVQHNNSAHNTFTSKNRPWELVAVFLVGPSEAEAMRIEKFIKK